MSNDSLHSLPWFSGESYNRVLAATPQEDSPPDFFYVPERTFVLVNRPLPRPITPRPITPRPLAPVYDFSQDAQRFEFLQWSPPALRETPFRYSEMTQSGDSECHSYRQALPPHSLSSDMFSSATRGPYLIDALEFSPSPLRQSQIDAWLQSTPISTSVPPETDLLVFGRILNTPQSPRNESGWAEDGYNDILGIHMLAHEKDEWYNDGADEVLNHHMDAFKYTQV